MFYLGLNVGFVTWDEIMKNEGYLQRFISVLSGTFCSQFVREMQKEYKEEKITLIWIRDGQFLTEETTTFNNKSESLIKYY